MYIPHPKVITHYIKPYITTNCHTSTPMQYGFNSAERWNTIVLSFDEVIIKIKMAENVGDVTSVLDLHFKQDQEYIIKEGKRVSNAVYLAC